MADEAAMILSAIEKLDSWLQLKKADLRDDENGKLGRLMLEKTPDDLFSAVVGMAELWQDNREKLLNLLVKVADPRKGTNAEVLEIKENVYWLVVEMMDLWEDNGNKENLHNMQLIEERYLSMAVEMVDIWNLGKRKLKSWLANTAVHLKEEKLHNLLLKKPNPMALDERYFGLAVEMADIWDVSKGKFRKEKLNSWLVNKLDVHHNKEKLNRWLVNSLKHDIRVSRRDDEEDMGIHAEIWKQVEGARNELRVILSVKKLEGLQYDYFMSDVVEMAHDALLFVRVIESDAFILFLQIFNCFIRERRIDAQRGPLWNLWRKILYTREGLEEARKRMLELGDELMVIPIPSPAPADSHVVGLEQDVELLLHKTNDNDIIYIRGMTGIGKTTLARELYNHPTVVDQYKRRRAWVDLSSRELSRKELLIKLISQLADDDDDDHVLLEKMDNKSLRQMLHQHLQGKPYFIVVDHVSSDICFEYVTKALPHDKGSVLLFTTRSPCLRFMVNYFKRYDHYMKRLDDDKSWQLLLKSVKCDEKCPKKLERKGRQILMRKCGGLPLAIKEIGRHWSEKRQSGSEWEELVVEESSLDLDMSGTLAALESTCLDLDPEVKSCFLRLALFKEGSTIMANKLVQILIAGGMEEKESKDCLSILTRESIIEAKHKTKSLYEKRIKSYRINAIFHMLSIKKAEDDEIGCEIPMKDGVNQSHHHHRVIYCSREDLSQNHQGKHLDSLFFHGGGRLDWNIIHDHFELLKILDMDGFGLKILPETIGDLTELRYLGLRSNYIQELPQSLGRLKMLEVLDISQNFMVEVPDIFWEMDRLRHLYISDIICRKPLKIDALNNLETLEYISIDDWTYEVSHLKNMMTSLRRLGIEEVDGNSNLSKLFTSLAELTNLDFLILKGFSFKSMPSLDELGYLQNLTELKLEGRLTRLPSAGNFPPYLSKLILVDSYLDKDPMPILEKLEILEYLKLQNAYTGQRMVISSVGFLWLNYLLMRELWHLRYLQVGKGALPNLCQLEINSCPNLDTIPEEISLCSTPRVNEMKIMLMMRKQENRQQKPLTDASPTLQRRTYFIVLDLMSSSYDWA